MYWRCQRAEPTGRAGSMSDRLRKKMAAAIPTSRAVTPICTNTSENAVPTDLAANRLGTPFAP
jgi:hypothetical protein